MEAPQHIVEALQSIRSGLNLRWNPTAKMVKHGGYDAAGKLIKPEYDGRFELWDKDPHGFEYMVMRVQDSDEGFRMPGEWLVEHINRFNPEKYNGDPGRMMAQLEREAEALQELADKDFDDLAGAAARWCADLRTPKSAAALSFRGQRVLAPGMN